MQVRNREENGIKLKQNHTHDLLYYMSSSDSKQKSAAQSQLNRLQTGQGLTLDKGSGLLNIFTNLRLFPVARLKIGVEVPRNRRALCVLTVYSASLGDCHVDISYEYSPYL